jgi:hypothetical protein
VGFLAEEVGAITDGEAHAAAEVAADAGDEFARSFLAVDGAGVVEDAGGDGHAPLSRDGDLVEECHGRGSPMLKNLSYH